MQVLLGLVSASGFFGLGGRRSELPPPPPPPPPSLVENMWSAYEIASPYILGVLIVWACITLLTYLIPVLLANLRGVQDLKKRYGAEWALVTGASSGIGKAIAEALAEQQINVVVAALNDELLLKSFEELKVKYPKVQFRCVGVDLTLADGTYMQLIETATKDIDVSLLFLNAGFMVTGFFHQVKIGKHMANLQCSACPHVVLSMVTVAPSQEP